MNSREHRRLVDDSEGNLTIKLRSEMIIRSTRSEIEKRGILMIAQRFTRGVYIYSTSLE